MGEIQGLHIQCEIDKPYLTQYDAYGLRQDSLYTSPAWKKQKHIAAEEGLIAIGYERKYAEFRYNFCSSHIAILMCLRLNHACL